MPTRSRGNSSLMIAKLSGKTAPPSPWTHRNAISDQTFHAKIRGDAPDEEDGQADDEQPALAVLVAKLAEDGRRDGGHEQEAREEPRRPRGRRVQIALQRRQRGHDHRLLQGERKPREREHREREVVVRAVETVCHGPASLRCVTKRGF
jgi:hypothetical protein